MRSRESGERIREPLQLKRSSRSPRNASRAREALIEYGAPRAMISVNFVSSRFEISSRISHRVSRGAPGRALCGAYARLSACIMKRRSGARSHSVSLTYESNYDAIAFSAERSDSTGSPPG